MAKGDRKYYKALRIAEQEEYDSRQVIELLSDSIHEGNKKAAYALASWYLNGFHVRKNYRKAFELLKIAVQGGKENGFHLYKDALLDIAICYELGNGVKKDTQMAFLHYLLAAVNGDNQALKELSRCYYYGIGITKNEFLSTNIDEYLQTVREKNEG